MNLILQISVKASDVFALPEKLYVFTSSSVMHMKWIEAQRELLSQSERSAETIPAAQ